MAKMVGVWMYVVPRKPSDDVKLEGAATLILYEADKRKLGNSSMTLQIRVMDDDTLNDNEVYKDDTFQIGPANLNVGHTTIGISATVPRNKVAQSEPWYESYAELYFRVRAKGGGVKTNWDNSQIESVAFE